MRIMIKISLYLLVSEFLFCRVLWKAKITSSFDFMDRFKHVFSLFLNMPDDHFRFFSFTEKVMEKASKIDSVDLLEKETLLTTDPLDTEDCSAAESLSAQPSSSIVSENFSSQLKISSKKDRLDVSLAPLDRPRSTTPINIASLEAFINSAPTSVEQNFQRLKVSLPGDQFSGQQRSKSPRRTNPETWSKFCEKGLQSPKNRYQRSSTIDESTLKPSIDLNDAFMPVGDGSSSAEISTTPTSPIDSGDHWTPFEDDFNSLRFPSDIQEGCGESFYSGKSEDNRCNLQSSE